MAGRMQAPHLAPTRSDLQKSLQGCLGGRNGFKPKFYYSRMTNFSLPFFIRLLKFKLTCLWCCFIMVQTSFIKYSGKFCFDWHPNKQVNWKSFGSQEENSYKKKKTQKFRVQVVTHGLMVIAVGFWIHWLKRTRFKPRSWNFLSIACDVKLEGALYSVFYAEASKRPCISLNE